MLKTKRDRLRGELIDMTGESYASVSARMQAATEDCCGAYRHTWECGWLEHQIVIARISEGAKS